MAGTVLGVWVSSRDSRTVEHPWWRSADDSGSHSLLVGITDERAAVPGSVSVDIEGYV